MPSKVRVLPSIRWHPTHYYLKDLLKDSTQAADIQFTTLRDAKTRISRDLSFLASSVTVCKLRCGAFAVALARQDDTASSLQTDILDLSGRLHAIEAEQPLLRNLMSETLLETIMLSDAHRKASLPQPRTLDTEIGDRLGYDSSNVSSTSDFAPDPLLASPSLSSENDTAIFSEYDAVGSISDYEHDLTAEVDHDTLPSVRLSNSFISNTSGEHLLQNVDVIEQEHGQALSLPVYFLPLRYERFPESLASSFPVRLVCLPSPF